MATLQQRKNLINSPLLHDKIRIAAYDIAVAVLLDPNRTTEHPYFQNIINNPDKWNTMPLAWLVATNPDIQEKMVTNPSAHSEDALDQDISYVVTVEIVKFSVPVNTNVQP
ncbi:hypothetical protein [Adhaeribacter aquaticus]|uniref:hypothetical protein n=1 Tax=Adhaeribacter aquaticus TaxID=299567 RepID=UPI000413D75D|nr:hypothetical protein [Adhaeribacter aquaticus]